MIIVKTKSGDHFINEKAVTEVKHDREKAVVDCWGANGYYSHHEDVEGVVYTNDAQPTSWKDEGSEIKRLTEELEERKEYCSNIRSEYLKIAQECDELKARVADLEPKTPKYENDPVTVITGHIRLSEWKRGYDVRLRTIFDDNDIKTVGDLLRIGRLTFRKYRNVGRKSIYVLDNALNELYDIKGW